MTVCLFVGRQCTEPIKLEENIHVKIRIASGCSILICKPEESMHSRLVLYIVLIAELPNLYIMIHFYMKMILDYLRLDPSVLVRVLQLV